VPYALVDQVEQQLADRGQEGYLRGGFQLQMGDFNCCSWPKPSGKVRIKPEIACDGNPIPKVKDLFEKIGGGLLHNKGTWLRPICQFEANPQLQEKSTLITPVRLLKPRSLSSGNNSALAIFQSKQDELLGGLKAL